MLPWATALPADSNNSFVLAKDGPQSGPTQKTEPILTIRRLLDYGWRNDALKFVS